MKTRPKEDYEPRNIILNLRVNKEEAEWIEQKFQNSGMKSKSDFIRMMIFQGQIIKVSDNFVRDFRRKYTSVSNNINQIALRLNASGNIYAEDIAEIKNGVNVIWQQLKYFQSLLLRVKPSPTLEVLQRPKTED
ncbi:plasmid mobilization relaxosome protein MobC [Ruminococcus bicirculans]|uniref:Plasmid mobilization relaxosome protein MobC n=1 Tax=Ruminococcus bicirculans (ex Wegman et al. 2014) TaxID=1160721 RepID=A0AAW6ED41_9FIRM|nr:plasmid mobilization relaxosome protein MobC [Ruminococcus bicirculans (ex Wegman et al. 2014)]MDB8750460.1 plasmid mobilization relaxosome protein MobC [Ruminococcus bicirculans (ex Wegman et al. 2014)]